jgi:hypothetical protein
MLAQHEHPRDNASGGEKKHRIPSSVPSVNVPYRHLQLDDVADGVVVVGAVALDAWVHVVGVDGRVVRGRADARVAGDPWRPHPQPELGEHRVQRLRCKRGHR